MPAASGRICRYSGGAGDHHLPRSELGRGARPVRVEVMAAADAVRLLLRHRPAEEAEDAKALADALGYLPLALAQAAAYCDYTGRTLRAYLDLLQTREAVLLAQPQMPHDYPTPVAAAWDLAFAAIEATPGAADLLNLLAYLAPDAFPKRLLQEHADALQDDLASIAKDPFQLDQAIAALRSTSLVEISGEMLSTHRLVQTITRCRAAGAELGVAGAAVRLINAALPFAANDHREWPIYAELLAHATIAASHAERIDTEPKATGTVLNQVALYLKSRAAYDEALPLYQRAIAITEKALDRSTRTLLPGSTISPLCIALRAGMTRRCRFISGRSRSARRGSARSTRTLLPRSTISPICIALRAGMTRRCRFISGISRSLRKHSDRSTRPWPSALNNLATLHRDQGPV